MSEPENQTRSRIEMLPWHSAARERLETAVEGGRLPHALLLQGPAGVGKERFAAALAAALLCTGRGARLEACHVCAECALTGAGSHPDLHWLRRPEDRKTISVDQVRELAERLSMTSMRRGRRLAIVSPAHAMTINAQNALLKTLEEPASGTLLLLVSSRPSAILPTLRSRCQRVELARPGEDLARTWLTGELGSEPPARLLELAHGAPFRALELAPHVADLDAQMCDLLEAYLAGRRDVTATAEDMLGDGLPARLDWLETWLGELARRRLIADAKPVTLPACPVLQRVGGEVNITALFGLVDRLREAKRLLDGPVAGQLLVESWLVRARRQFAIERSGWMSPVSRQPNKPGLLTLTIKDKSALYLAYMPFVKNGGLFIPTSSNYRLGDEVFMLLNLMGEDEKLPVAGRVIWMTPKGAQGKRTAGIGVQFSDQDRGNTQRKIESYLAGALGGDKPTHTM